MKTQVILIATLLLFATTAFATQPPSAVAQQVQKEMTYPAEAAASHTEGIVYVSFETTADGAVHVLETNCPIESLRKAVEKNLARMNAKKLGAAPNSRYNMKLKFQLR